jgi:TorA maturation chaperone TorD
MGSQTKLDVSGVSAEDYLRADLYDFLGALLARPPSDDMLAKIAALTGDDSEIGQCIATLKKLAQSMAARTVEREYNELFIGLGRGELLPHASFYLTGFLNEKPLARLREDMGRLGIARAEGVAEPEDRIGSLMEMMAGLIRGTFGNAASIEAQKCFFEDHLEPWAGHFFTDLEAAEASVFYAPAGRIGRVFIDIETDAFRMSS